MFCLFRSSVVQKFSSLEVQKLFGFAVAVEDGTNKHGQDGVDEPDECDGKGYAGCIRTEDTKNNERPSATDGDVSRRYGWEDGHHHVVEWDGDHVLHEGHVHAAEMEREGELDCPDDIAEHGPCDGLHEERIGHMRERKGELAHLGVVPLVAREIAHEVRQETEQEHQDDERYGEILHGDSRMVADKEPCGRNAEDEFNNEQSHGADKTETDGCGEVALILEEHGTSGIIACVIWSYESADIAVIDLALSTPDGHGFGFAKQQTPFARFCHDIERHKQKGGDEGEPQTDIAGAKGAEKR